MEAIGPHSGRRIGQLTEAETHRFWSYVGRIWDDETFCWEWLGGLTGPNGYGMFSLRDDMVLAHRVAFTLAHGEIPRGAVVGHTCDNPRCCRPEHLFAGMQHDNLDDMRTKGRGPWKPAEGYADHRFGS